MKLKRVKNAYYILFDGGKYRKAREAKPVRIKGYHDLFVHRSVGAEGRLLKGYNVSDAYTGLSVSGPFTEPTPAGARYWTAMRLMDRTPAFMEEKRQEAIAQGHLSPRYRKG